jgi:hypothetical protein
VGPRPLATTEVPKRSPSSGKPSKRFYPAMSSGRCPVPPLGEDGGLLRTRFTSALLPRLRLRQAVLDLPPLRPGTALLQPAVPPTSLSATAASRQPPPPTKSRGTTRSPGPSAGVSPTPNPCSRDGSRFPSFLFPLQDAAAGHNSHARSAPE